MLDKIVNITIYGFVVYILKKKKYLYLNSSNEKFTCTRYNLSKNHDTNFEDEIGLEHDIKSNN